MSYNCCFLSAFRKRTDPVSPLLGTSPRQEELLLNATVDESALPIESTPLYNLLNQFSTERLQLANPLLVAFCRRLQLSDLVLPLSRLVSLIIIPLHGYLTTRVDFVIGGVPSIDDRASIVDRSVTPQNIPSCSAAAPTGRR